MPTLANRASRLLVLALTASLAALPARAQQAEASFPDPAVEGAQAQPDQTGKADKAAAAGLVPAARPTRFVVRTFEERLIGGALKRVEVVKSWSYPAAALEPDQLAVMGQARGASWDALRKAESQIESRRAQPTRFVRGASGWAAQDVSGWQVDRDALADAMRAAAASGASDIEVPLTRVLAPRTARSLYDQGIREHLSTGESSFAGSPSFRVTNVMVGAARFDGLKVPVGGVFDFNAVMGPTTRARGFVPGYVISGGTLKLEDGGGICQVSTTAFRALYQAGLPVVERHNHSHVVHYYDPVGFEATVYAPSKNLRMRNDTPGALWIQVRADARGERLAFDVFGRSDGRRVEVSAPVLSGWRAAPAARWTTDRRLAPGARRLIDVAQRGVTSVITRRVTGGVSPRTETLRSVYAPWGALYAVGPRR